MNLTTKGRYAVMAMVDLGMQNRTVPVTLAEISKRQNIALSYLEQIFMRLRRAGLVDSVRGPGGGYVLSGKNENIKISDIIVAVDESIKITRCSDKSGGGCSHNKTKCVTHNLWDGLSRQIFSYLDNISLGDICDKNSSEEVRLHA